MSNKKKAAANAKKAAFAAKQEEEGRKVINYIFGALIALGALFAIYSCFIMN